MFNLINDIDVPETEARIAAYRKENAALIELNLQREEQYAQYLKEQEEAEMGKDDDDYWGDPNMKQRLQSLVDDLTREVCSIRNGV